MAAAHMLRWNGKDLPDELRELPPGTYVVEPVEPSPQLTPEEEAGLKAALTSLQRQKGRTLEQVRQTIDDILRR